MRSVLLVLGKALFMNKHPGFLLVVGDDYVRQRGSTDHWWGTYHTYESAENEGLRLISSAYEVYEWYEVVDLSGWVLKDE